MTPVGRPGGRRVVHHMPRADVQKTFHDITLRDFIVVVSPAIVETSGLGLRTLPDVPAFLDQSLQESASGFGLVARMGEWLAVKIERFLVTFAAFPVLFILNPAIPRARGNDISPPIRFEQGMAVFMRIIVMVAPDEAAGAEFLRQ